MNKNLCELVVNPEIKDEELERMSGFARSEHEMLEYYTEKKYGFFAAIDKKKTELEAKIKKCINYAKENDNKFVDVYYNIETDEFFGIASEMTFTINTDANNAFWTIINANAEITEHNIADATEKVIARRKHFGYARIQFYETDILLARIAKI